MTPRAIKRLINVSKVIKLIWYRRGTQPSEPVVRGAFVLLALSERYPGLMRELLDTLVAVARTKDPVADTIVHLIDAHQPVYLNAYLRREWASLRHVMLETDLFPRDLTPVGMELETLNLVRSFCFVGDTGFDPADAREGSRSREQTADPPRPAEAEEGQQRLDADDDA
jgi:hypothetical protein